MKYLILILKLFFTLLVIAQNKNVSKNKFVIGIAAPELIHAGYTYRISNNNLVGINAGLAPSFGEVWSAVSIEHRIYLGENDPRINQKTWFCRQGFTFFSSGNDKQKFALNLTGGKDIVFKNLKSGISIDAGVIYLPNSGSSSISIGKKLSLLPALRFQFYASL